MFVLVGYQCLKNIREKNNYVPHDSQINKKYNLNVIISKNKIKHTEVSRVKATLEWSVINGQWLAWAFELRHRL